jgi:hypothetical protein
MKVKSVVICCAVCLAAGLVGGFVAGRKTIKETVKYVREETVAGTIERVELIGVDVPEVPVLPVRVDTVFVDRVMYTREVVDTATIIADYVLRRSYATQLFDNQYGKLNVSLSAQYNRVGSVSYEFIPVTKTVYRDRVWRPFVVASFSSLGAVGLGGGMFYKSMGAGVQYVTDFKRNGIGISIYKAF